MVQPVKRRYSQEAWKAFAEKLTKYIGADQPVGFVYAVRDMLARVTSDNGLNDSYVKAIGKKYFISDADQERLLELKQKWDRFQRKFARLEEKYQNPTEARKAKWDSEEFVQVRNRIADIQSEISNQFFTIDAGQQHGLRAFQLNVHKILETEAREKALASEAEQVRQQRELDRTVAIDQLGAGFSPHVKTLFENNYQINADVADTIKTTFNSLMTHRLLKKSEFRNEFVRQVERKTGVTLSRYEFEEIWNASQLRIANQARAEVEAVKVNSPPDPEMRNHDYHQLRESLKETRKILSSKKTRNSFDAGNFEHLYRAINDTRKLDNAHLKALFGTNSTKKAKKFQEKLLEKLARRVSEARKAKLVDKANIDGFKLTRSIAMSPQDIVRPLYSSEVDAAVSRIAGQFDALNAVETHDEKLQQRIAKLEKEFANWRIDNAGTANDWRGKAIDKEAYLLGLEEALEMIPQLKIQNHESLIEQERQNIFGIIKGMSDYLAKLDISNLPDELQNDVADFRKQAAEWIDDNKKGDIQFLRDQIGIIRDEYFNLNNAVSSALKAFEAAPELPGVGEESITAETSTETSVEISEEGWVTLPSSLDSEAPNEPEPVVVELKDDKAEAVRLQAEALQKFKADTTAIIEDLNERLRKLDSSVSSEVGLARDAVTMVSDLQTRMLEENQSATPSELQEKFKQFQKQVEAAKGTVKRVSETIISVETMKSAEREIRDQNVNKCNVMLAKVEQQIIAIQAMPGFNDKNPTYLQMVEWLNQEKRWIEDSKDTFSRGVTDAFGRRLMAYGPLSYGQQLEKAENFAKVLAAAPKQVVSSPASTSAMMATLMKPDELQATMDAAKSPTTPSNILDNQINEMIKEISRLGKELRVAGDDPSMRNELAVVRKELMEDKSINKEKCDLISNKLKAFEAKMKNHVFEAKVRNHADVRTVITDAADVPQDDNPSPSNGF